MASVLFATVGQAIGGPLGAGIGLAVGAGADSALFRRPRGRAREGYALGSAYGEPLPRLFGLARVGGQLIWAQGPDEAVSRKGGGRPASTASLAVALSRGPIREVRRIWADGRLFRDVDGVAEQDVVIRVHPGNGLVPDPVIAAAEGMDGAPAFLGLSYVVFEGLQLEPFGNRIPAFSFEVLADSDGPGGWLAAAAAEGGLVAEAGAAPAGALGYVAWGSPLEEDLMALAGVADARLRLAGGEARLGGEGRMFALVVDDWLSGEEEGGQAAVRWTADRPSSIEVGYLDAARDYQLGLQRVARSRAGRAVDLSWQMSSGAGAAHALAHRLLAEAEAAAERLSLELPLRWLEIAVGDVVALPAGGSWRIASRDVRGGRVLIEAERVAVSGPRPGEEADPGRALPSELARVPATRVVSLEIPVPRDGTAPVLLLGAGGGPGWRGAELSVLQGGETIPLGRVEPGIAFGRLLAPLEPGPDTVWDERNALLVAVEAGDFLSRGRLDVLQGGGLLIVGDELVQYRDGLEVAPGVVRLSGLLRRRQATSPSGSPHPAGTDVFAVGTRTVSVPLSVEQIGAELVGLAAGRGDPAGGTLFVSTVKGAGFAPLAPVHLQGRRLADGSLSCSWVRRARTGWRWPEDPAPQADTAMFWVFRETAGGEWRTAVAGDSILLSAADQSARFGRPLAAGAFAIEMAGEGPLALRRSRWAAL